MGESERYIEYRQFKKNRPFSLGSDNNALISLIIMNLVFFMLMLLFQVIYHFYHESTATYYNDLVTWFVVPGQWSDMIHKPWVLFTHMFTATGYNFFIIISNLIWLYAFGNVLQQYMGGERLFPVYIYGGLISALFFCTASSLVAGFPSGNAMAHDLFGAGPSVMSIAVATTILAKEHRFFTHIGKGIPIFVLLILYVVIDMLGVAPLPWIYAVTHLVGGLTGAMFSWLLINGKDTGIWMSRTYHKMSNLFTPKIDTSKKDIKQKIFYNTRNKEPFSKQPNYNQQKIDQILEKIHLKGMDSLTEEERAILKKAADDES